jgi:hypothetical protein
VLALLFLICGVVLLLASQVVVEVVPQEMAKREVVDLALITTLQVQLHNMDMVDLVVHMMHPLHILALDLVGAMDGFHGTMVHLLLDMQLQIFKTEDMEAMEVDIQGRYRLTLPQDLEEL